MSGSVKGLKYPICAPIAREIGGQYIYGKGTTLGKGIQVALNLEGGSDSSLYGDDAIAESDNSFAGGNLTLNATRLDYSARAMLFGDRVENAGLEDEPEAEKLISNAGSSGNPVGFGFYGVVQRDQKTMYRAMWVYKVTFSPPSETFDTRQGSTKWGTPNTTGTINAPGGGDWKEEITVSDEQTAVKWLNDKAHIIPPIGLLEILAEEGEHVGETQLIVLPKPDIGNKYRISATLAEAPAYNALCASGYQDWDGKTGIPAADNADILIVECTAKNRARKAGTVRAVTRKAARVTFTLSPIDALLEVTQNGVPVAPETDGAYVLTQGQYQYSVGRDGYAAQTEYFEVTADDVMSGIATISVTLTVSQENSQVDRAKVGDARMQ